MGKEGTLIFAKNSGGKVLVGGGNLLSQKMIPLREVDFESKKISFDGVYISEIEVLGNKNGLQPGVYSVAYAKNLLGLEECVYAKVDLDKFPLLKDLNRHWSVLFGVS